MNDLLRILEDVSQPSHIRIDAARRVVKKMNSARQALNNFKKELEDQYPDGGFIETPIGTTCEIVKFDPAPTIESLEYETLVQAIGVDNFNRYISNSFNIRWTSFRDAPPDIKTALQNLAPPRPSNYKITFK